MAPERKLRSKDEGRKQNPTLFNFDKVNKLLYRDQNITVKRKDNDKQNSYGGIPEFTASNEGVPKPRTSSSLIVIDTLLPRKTKGQLDPLNDSIYSTFHKKMRKEEKKMTNIDRTRILNEVDTLTTLLLLLQQYDWIRHIQSITQVHNPHDYKELEYKRVLTIFEIKRILKKFDSWKKREDELNYEIKEFHRNGAHLAGKGENSIENEFNMSIEQLKRKRKTERCKKFGQIIRLKLSNGLELIIDPILPPKFIHRNTYSESPVPNPTTTTSIPKLGIEIPDIKPQPYTIPQYWKNHHKDWEPERKKLRNILHS